MNRREFARLVCAFGAVPPPEENRLGKRPQFRSESTQVLIPFTAVDKHDHLVTTLSVDDLRLLDDGTERKISSLSLEEGPVSILFVLDISGSMKKSVVDLQEAVRRMLRAADKDDEFGVIEFSDRPELTIGFTNSLRRVDERVRAITPSGHTSLTDAMMLAFGEVRRGHQPRKALIVLSDGAENHSRYVREQAMRMAGETDVRVYGVELYPTIGEGFNAPTFLESLARNTGGRYFATVDRKSIPEIVERIDVHRSYVLGFKPPAERRDGKFHRVDLKLRRRPSGDRLKLFWKECYRTPLE